jgi:hypothetical protein
VVEIGWKGEEDQGDFPTETVAFVLRMKPRSGSSPKASIDYREESEMTESDILLHARYRASCRTKRPAIKEKILNGRWDDKASVIRARREVEREVTLAASQGMKAISAEEEEPNFRPLLDRAKARMDQLGDTPDGNLIRNLLGMVDHLYGEIEAMENHISDYGPPCEEDDDPAYLAAILANA